jgi:outer membrane protein W
MKHITFFLCVLAVLASTSYSAGQDLAKLEIDLAVGFHNFSSAQLQATNSVTWYSDPGGQIHNHSGYGMSIMPAFNAAWYFTDNLGASLGVTVVNAENDLFVEGHEANYNYQNTMEQYHLTPALAFRHSPDMGRVTFNMKTGLALVPFYIEHQYDADGGSYFMNGEDFAGGPFTEIGMKLQLFKFLYLKTDIAYTYLESSYTLYGEGAQTSYNNVNLGGITVKTGLTFSFIK